MWQRGDRRQQYQKPPSGRPAAGPTPGIFRFPKRHAYLILLIVVTVVSYYQPRLSAFFTSAKETSAQTVSQQNIISADRNAVEFMTTIMATLTETWQGLFQKQGLHYSPPEWVIYRNTVSSPCQPTQPAEGIFYCPENQTLYLSLDLYDELKNRPLAESELTLGYILAHAVGHHVQSLPGSNKPAPYNRQAEELQADCFAGLWAHRMVAQHILSRQGWQTALKVDALLNAIRRQHTDVPLMPEDFSYATATARYQHFSQGFTDGELKQCLIKEGSPAIS